jgi:TatD DNase family protein
MASGSPSWFDSHCHIQERYLPEEADAGSFDEALVAQLARATEAGVTDVVCVGTDVATSTQAVELAQRSAAGEFSAGPRIYATVGLHPHEASQGTETLAALLDSAAHESAVVGIGECGLDYYYEHSPRDAQRQAFREQIEMAKRLDLTLVIHARDAWDDLFEILDDSGVPSRAVLHCFTGGPSEAQGCVERGLFVSFSGIVTFKNATDVREAVVRCPEERLLIETDSPFLSPVPHRGKPNEPGFVPLVGRAVAQARGVAEAALAASSTRATRAAFAL